MKKTFNNKIVTCVLGVALLSSAYGVVPPQYVHAQSNMSRTELIALIQQLINMLSQYQAESQVPTVKDKDSQLASHLEGRIMRVRENVNVRSSASIQGTLMGVQRVGARGTVLAGPIERNGHSWWKVAYNNGVTGWSSGASLEFTEDYAATDRAISISYVDINKDKIYLNDSELKVSWKTVGTLPKGSNACVTLLNLETNNQFAHPSSGGSCVNIVGGGKSQSVAAELVQTAGHDLAPGTYIAQVRIIGPTDGGKDGEELAVANSKKFKVEQKKQYFQALLNNETIATMFGVTKQTAQSLCKDIYNDYDTYNFVGGDVLECLWGGIEFETITGWKG